MNKLAAIRIVYEDGTYSDPIPITALMKNIQWSESKSLLDVLGEDLNDDGESVKDKFDRLKSLVNNIITFIDNIPEWTKQSEKPTYTAQEVGALPVSSIDETLKIQGAAADAKTTGDEINSLKNGINNIGTLSDLKTEYKDDLVGAINEISAISAIDEAESARQAAAEAVSAATEITNRLNEIQPTLDEVQEVISSISSQTKASKDVFGIVKIGDNLNIQDGVLSADPPGSNIDIDSVINSTSTNPVQNKIINAALENKVNKDGNKVLSTNDYTTAEKDKLNSLKNYSEITGQQIASGTDTTAGVISPSILSDAIDSKITSAITGLVAPGAAVFQTTVSSNDTIVNANYKKGYYWVVAAEGTYIGQSCEAGDMIFCINDKNTAYNVNDFTIVQNNIVAISNADIDSIAI